MDSYTSSYREPTSDRARPREDSRARDGRPDYRGRSPGMDRRDRRRSRSPGPVDRYEPRSRRDDRDRDDRRRQTPPSNIDRYVPGQDPSFAAPLMNPLPDPVKLPYQVGFSYFGEWWRMNEKIKDDKERAKTGRRREAPRGRDTQEDKDKEKAKIQASYDVYKEELQAKTARLFVAEHKKEQWFRERYVSEVRDEIKGRLNEARKGVYSQWEQDLESGTFDDFSLEGIPKSESNGAGGLVEKEEGEATAANEVLGVADLVPAEGSDIRDENLFQPTLLIKTIAPHVSRQNLEAFCKEHLGEEEGGFKWLSLSDPNPSKRFHRIGWVLLHPLSDTAMPVDREDPKDEDGDEGISTPQPTSAADKALEAINGKTVKDEVRGDFVCHVGVHNPPQQPRKKALWDLFSAPERIDKDLQLILRVVNKFEEDFGTDFQAALKVEEKVEELRNSGRLRPTVQPTTATKKQKREIGMDEAMDDGTEGMEQDDDDEEEGAIEDDDDEVDDEDLLSKKKQLDLLIEYLRRVFNFCFFCVFESDSVHELTRKCPGGHLRRLRSTLTTTARAVARASALGEPFPGAKKDEPMDEGEIEGDERDKKLRNPANKAEQQLLRAYNWVKTYEDKLTQILDPQAVDLKKLGGRDVDQALDEELANHVKQEDEHKWRCKAPDCTKLFKEEHFWKKHVEKRHTEWLDSMKQEFELINAYVLDPAHIAPSRTDANSNGHFRPGQGQSVTGTPRGFNLSNFSMGGVMNMPNLAMNPGQFSAMFAGMPGGSVHPHGGDRGGPLRRGGMSGGRGQYRTGPYDRRGGRSDGRGRGRQGAGWGDGAGAAAGAPREAVQGRSLKSYEDLDQVSGSGGGELNY